MEVASTSQTTSSNFDASSSPSMNNPDSQLPTSIDAPRTDTRDSKIVSGHSDLITTHTTSGTDPDAQHPQDQATAPLTSNTSQEMAAQVDFASNQSPSDSISRSDPPQTRLDVTQYQNTKLDVSLHMPFSLASIVQQGHVPESSSSRIIDTSKSLPLPSAIANRFPYLKSHFSNLLLQNRHPPIASAPTSTTDRPITIFSKAHISRPITAEQPPFSSFTALFSQTDLDAFPLDDYHAQSPSIRLETTSTTDSSTSATIEPQADFDEGMMDNQANSEDRIELDHRTELEEQRKRRLEAFAEGDAREAEEEQLRKKTKRERKREKQKRSKQRKRAAAAAAHTDAGAIQLGEHTGSTELMLADVAEVEEGEIREEDPSTLLISSNSTRGPLRPSRDVPPASHSESNHSNATLTESQITPDQTAITQNNTRTNTSMTAATRPSPLSSRSPSPVSPQHPTLSLFVHQSSSNEITSGVNASADEEEAEEEDEDSALLTLEQEVEFFARSRSASVDHSPTSPSQSQEVPKQAAQPAPSGSGQGRYEDVGHPTVADSSSLETGQLGEPLSSDLSELEETSADVSGEGEAQLVSREGLMDIDGSEGDQTVSSSDQIVPRMALADYLDQALAKEMKDVYTPWWEENASSSSLRSLLADRDRIFKSQRGQVDDKKQEEAIKAITSPKVSIGEQTQRHYLSHFAEYIAFCRILEVPAFPITAELSILFLYQHRIQWPKSSRKINDVALRTIARWTSDIFSDEDDTTAVDWNSDKELIGVLQECVSTKKGSKQAKAQPVKTATTTQAVPPFRSSISEHPPRSNIVPLSPAPAPNLSSLPSTIGAPAASSPTAQDTTTASSDSRRLRSRLASTKSTLSSSPSKIADRNGVGKSVAKEKEFTSTSYQQSAACSNIPTAQEILEEGNSSNAKSPVLSLPQPSSSLARTSNSALLPPPRRPSDIVKSLNPKSTATAQARFAKSSPHPTSHRQSMRAAQTDSMTSFSSLPAVSLSSNPIPRLEVLHQLVPQLLSFLNALDRSLLPLAPLLQAAGYRTLDSLVELASLEPSTRNRMYQEIIARADNVDGKLFALLESKLIEAQEGDWKD